MFYNYTYPYFTYISNFQFSPTHKSTQSYHTQPKHNPLPYHNPIPPTQSRPLNTHISLLYPLIHPPTSTPITSPSPSLTYPPYRSFIVLSISNPTQPYPTLPNPTHISLTLTPIYPSLHPTPTFTYLYKINVYP